LISAAREVVYEETSPGVFAPAPTPAQKRAAKREPKLRAEKRQGASICFWGVLLCASIAAVFVCVEAMWITDGKVLRWLASPS
jgi:hypothetical protein